jgi:hypothetical protein
MNSGIVYQLLQFIASPLGLISLIFGSILLLYSLRSRVGAWLLFAMCCFASTLGKFQSQFLLEPPALAFPLQQLREVGRPLTLLLLGMLVLLSLRQQPNWRQSLFPEPIKYLVALQTIIFLKTLLYGSISFALLTALTIGAVVFTIYAGPSRWLQDDKNFDLGVKAVAFVGILFISGITYQALFDLYPITFTGGRLLGTTGNPQAAALLLGCSLPCCLYMIEKPAQQIVARFFWGMVLLLLLLALLMTGSRTGLVMAGTSFLFFHRQRIRGLLHILLLVVLAVVPLYLLMDRNDLVWETFISPLTDRYSSLENSRTDIWNILWSSFLDYPLFGVPLTADRFTGYGESSWLGVAANLGLVGLVPLFLFAATSIRMMIRVYQLSLYQSQYFYRSSTVIAGLMTIFVGSIFEASLLGNLTFSVLSLFFYLALGQYLLELKQNITANQSRSGRLRHSPSSRTLRPTIASYRSTIY